MNELPPGAFNQSSFAERQNMQANARSTASHRPLSAPSERPSAEASGPGPVIVLQIGSLIRRWKLILACMLVAAALGVGYALLKPDHYVASALVLVGGGFVHPDAIAARGDVDTLRITLDQLTARKARLEAEIAGEEEVTFPPELLRQENDPTISAMLNGERLILAARNRSLAERLERLEQERTLSQQRAAAVEEQVRLAGVQVDAINQEIEAIDILVKQKLAAAPRLLDLQRTGAVIASRKVELESELLRVRQSIAETQQLMTEVLNDRQSEVLAEHQKVLSTLAEQASKRAGAAAVAGNYGQAQRFDSGMLANEIDVIESDSMASDVVQRLELHRNGSFLEAAKLPGDASDDDRIAAAIEILQKNLNVRRVEPGSKLEVSYRSRHSEEAALVANTVASRYVEQGGISTLPRAPASAEQYGERLENRGDRIIRTARQPETPAGPSAPTIAAAAALVGLIFGIGLVILIEAFAYVRTSSAGVAARF
jgi:uncharacterized protein (UPF0335 family)